MKLLTIFLLTLIFCFESSAQIVVVKDKVSRQPIKNVFVFNLSESKSVNTNDAGEFDVSIFANEDLISFQHPSYFDFTIQYVDLAKISEILLVEHIVEMDELVISANKWEQSISDIPSTIATIKSKEIEFQNPQTAADILESSGKVFVQKSQMGGGSPMIRGFAANSILIVVDGVRMNNAIFRSGNLHNILNIDPFMLESAEVIFGPGSVIYGSDALGGVLDFHTINPTFTKKPTADGALLARYSSANMEKTSMAKFSVSKENFALFGGFSFSDFDDLKAGSNRPDEDPDFGKREFFQTVENGVDLYKKNDNINIQRSSGYRQWNGLLKMKFKIDSESDLQYSSYFSNSSTIPRYDRLTRTRDGLPISAEWHYGPQQWIRNSIQYQKFGNWKWFNGMKFNAAHQSFRESRITRDFGDPIRTERKEKVDVFSANLDFDKAINSIGNLFYGAEFVRNSVNSNANSVNINDGSISSAQARYPDGGSTYTTSAIYTTLNQKLSEKLILSGGVRFNHINLYSSFNDKTFFDFPYDEVELATSSLNGNFGIVYKPATSWKLDFLISTGFRAPNIDDIGKLFDSEPGNILVPNPQLRPETATTMDVGISRTFKEKVKIEATAFYTWVADIMVRRNSTFNGADSIIYDGVLSRVQSLTNSESGIIYGVSIYFKAELSPVIALTSTYTYTTGEDEEGFPIRHASPVFGRTALLYAKDRWQAEIYSNYNGKLSFEDLAPSEQSKAYLYSKNGALAWFTLNAKFSVRLSQHIQFSGGVENIFDLHYRPYSSGISAAGRNYITSFKVKL